MDLLEMRKSQLVAAIRWIIAAKPGQDTAGSLIVTKLKEFMECLKISECEAVDRLADLGMNYGSDGKLGGINVYVDDDGDVTREVFTNEHNSTDLTHHLTLGAAILVNGYEQHPPRSFKPDWWLQEGTTDVSGLPRIFGDESEPVIYH